MPHHPARAFTCGFCGCCYLLLCFFVFAASSECTRALIARKRDKNRSYRPGMRHGCECVGAVSASVRAYVACVETAPMCKLDCRRWPKRSGPERRREMLSRGSTVVSDVAPARNGLRTVIRLPRRALFIRATGNFS